MMIDTSAAYALITSQKNNISATRVPLVALCILLIADLKLFRFSILFKLIFISENWN